MSGTAATPYAQQGSEGDGQGPKDEHQKRDRQMIELLNELRVALPGVQLLCAFLLAVPFTDRFRSLTAFQRDVFYITLIASTAATVCLIAPSAAHRVRFHARDRAWLIETASRLMLAGLAALAVALSCSVLLITDLMFDGVRVWLYPSLVALAIVGLWFVRPALRSESSGPH